MENSCKPLQVAGTEDINESKQVTSDTVRAETGLLEESSPNTDMLEEHKDPTLLPTSEKVVDTEKEVKQAQESPATATKEPQPEASPAEQPSAWGWGSGWSSWGRSLITSSVSGVSDSAKALGRGLESVVTKVEETLGVPSPEELAESNKEKGQVLEERSKSRMVVFKTQNGMNASLFSDCFCTSFDLWVRMPKLRFLVSRVEYSMVLG